MQRIDNRPNQEQPEMDRGVSIKKPLICQAGSAGAFAGSLFSPLRFPDTDMSSNAYRRSFCPGDVVQS